MSDIDYEDVRIQKKNESNKKWLEKNKDYFKDYYKNKKAEGKIKCEICHSQVMYSNMNRHKKSKIHLRFEVNKIYNKKKDDDKKQTKKEIKKEIKKESDSDSDSDSDISSVLTDIDLSYIESESD